MSCNDECHNCAAIQRFFAEIKRGNLDVIEEQASDVPAAAQQPETSPSAPEAERVSPRARLERFFRSFRVAFPDAHFAIQDIVATGDKVVTRLAVTGTHRGTPADGPLQGIPPTGKPMRVRMIFINEIVAGKIVAHWGLMDNLRLMQQLGIYPPDDEIVNRRS